MHAAATVTVISAGALLGSRIGGAARARAAAGCALVGAGVLALAFLPDAHLLWTRSPQAAAGLGMGLALPALGGELLPERDPQDAARRAGPTPRRDRPGAGGPSAHRQQQPGSRDGAREGARRGGRARRGLAPTEKLRLAPVLLAGVDEEEPRHGLRAALDTGRGTVAADEQAAYDEVARRTDDTLVLAVGEAFRTAFLVTGLLGLLAAAAVLPRRWTPALAAAGVTALVLPLAFVGLHAAKAPEAVQLSDPCKPRALPQTGGLEGFLQDRALEVLDTTACRGRRVARGAGPRARRRARAQALRAPPRRRSAQPLHAVARPARLRTTTTRAGVLRVAVQQPAGVGPPPSATCRDHRLGPHKDGPSPNYNLTKLRR